jgi:hypothetical protein
MPQTPQACEVGCFRDSRYRKPSQKRKYSADHRALKIRKKKERKFKRQKRMGCRKGRQTVVNGASRDSSWSLVGHFWTNSGGVERKLGRRPARYRESMIVAGIWLSKVRRASHSSSSVPCRLMSGFNPACLLCRMRSKSRNRILDIELFFLSRSAR